MPGRPELRMDFSAHFADTPISGISNSKPTAGMPLITRSPIRLVLSAVISFISSQLNEAKSMGG